MESIKHSSSSKSISMDGDMQVSSLVFKLLVPIKGCVVFYLLVFIRGDYCRL